MVATVSQHTGLLVFLAQFLHLLVLLGQSLQLFEDDVEGLAVDGRFGEVGLCLHGGDDAGVEVEGVGGFSICGFSIFRFPAGLLEAAGIVLHEVVHEAAPPKEDDLELYVGDGGDELRVVGATEEGGEEAVAGGADFSRRRTCGHGGCSGGRGGSVLKGDIALHQLLQVGVFVPLIVLQQAVGGAVSDALQTGDRDVPAGSVQVPLAGDDTLLVGEAEQGRGLRVVNPREVLLDERQHLPDVDGKETLPVPLPVMEGSDQSFRLSDTVGKA